MQERNPYHPEEIEQLFIDKLSGNITPEDEMTLNRLMEEDDGSLTRQFQQLSQTMELYKAVSHVERFPIEKRYDALVSDLQDDQYTSRFHWWKAAAAVFLPLLIGLTWWLLDSEQPPVILAGNDQSDSVILTLNNDQRLVLSDQEAVHVGDLMFSAKEAERVDLAKQHEEHRTVNITPERFVIQVPKGRTYKLTLADGTKVHLNADTRFTFPSSFDGHELREVVLDGEGFFEVMQQKDSPFVVRADGFNIHVLGTSFNVKNYPGEVSQAAVVTGKVQVAYPIGAGETQTVQLNPGLAVTVQDGKLHQASFDPEFVVGWTKGIYAFKNEQLIDLMKVVNRLTGLEVRIENPSLIESKFTGAFEQSKSVERFLDNLVLSASTKLRYKLDSDKIIIF